MNAYLNAYQNNHVATASPEQLLIMLYDGAIRFVRQAKEALASGDRPFKIERIGRAIAIIAEFRNTLDHEIGGEISANLDALYDYMLRELVQANVKNDLKPLEIVEGLLCDLRETWIQAIEINRRENAEAGNKGENTAAASYKPLQAAL